MNERLRPDFEPTAPSSDEHAPAAGKRTLTSRLPPSSRSAESIQFSSEERAAHEQRSLQWRALAVDPLAFLDDAREGGAHDVAADGVAGAQQALPHLDAIQASFGDHDVRGIRAEVGGPAERASAQLGAEAYATGDRVGFARAPDLHTAAHEAAHVVQQRAGVSLKGGLGQVGDPYEQHADRVADAVVAGRSAAPILDEMAAGRGEATSGVQRREEGSGFRLPPKIRFGAAGLAERKQILAAEHDRHERLEMLHAIAPRAAIELLLGADAVKLPPIALLDLIEHLPAVIAAMEPSEMVDLIATIGPRPATARIFAKLPFMTQLVAWRDISPPEARAEVWPSAAPIDRRTALVNTLSTQALHALLRGLGASQVQDLVDYAPPHLVARVREACREIGVHVEIAGAATADGDARADKFQIESEEWDAAHDKPEHVARPKSSEAPDVDTWLGLPRMAQTSIFRVAPTTKRIAYLARAGERAHALVASLDDLQDRAETLAAYARRYTLTADRLLGDAEPADLVAVIRVLHDPADVAAVFLAVSKHTNRVPLLLAVMEPREIAMVFQQTKDNDMARMWAAVAGNAPPATVTAVLRRLSDEQLARVADRSNEREQVESLTPPERRPGA